ncbi:Lysine exporter protein (LYSE/YGGA) [Psychromonas ingrahamii 37]|uniref:Lysine exporter protein (LYSE/YGGA) n=1 Tax=Psychromonas ingrahamii (strain DSM 17664 / CCUG 51855 / 37) TaxID=357804 RepID=A1T023_PSYIN|nr:LysE family transporter [Psychromonas ingrahamii]ABM05088.1 Lysine exporter protein (LYSE/YGGA) [Psychromonas ingrahamii 37]
MIAPYIDEFLMLTLVHFLAVIAPGPDFAVVIRQSISFGRKSALITSLGIGTGISIHVLYTLLGIGFIITQSETAFMVAKIAGALYLTYIGFNMLASKAQNQTDPQVVIDSDLNHHKGAFMLGFMTNLLNPKATLFFLAIFTAIVSIDTPLAVQSIYGLWIALTTALWFSLVSLFFSHRHVRAKFVRHGYLFERVMGGILLLFAAKLGWSLF